MKNIDPKLAQLKFSTPAFYRIKISGIVDENFGDYLGGMEITNIDFEKSITTLNGKMKDQAALSGVLNTLYDLRFTILNVEMIYRN